MTATRQKMVAWLTLLVAALACLGLASRSGDAADVTRAVGWALLGGLAVSLLLRTAGRRIVAVLLLVLAVGVATLAARGAHPALWAAAALAAAGALAQLLWSGGWASATRFERPGTIQPGTTQSVPTQSVPTEPATDLDVWKAFDAGLDPTSQGFGDNLASRETGPAGTHQHGSGDRGAHQEDQ